jgi:hypothetical protein
MANSPIPSPTPARKLPNPAVSDLPRHLRPSPHDPGEFPVLPSLSMDTLSSSSVLPALTTVVPRRCLLWAAHRWFPNIKAATSGLPLVFHFERTYSCIPAHVSSPDRGSTPSCTSAMVESSSPAVLLHLVACLVLFTNPLPAHWFVPLMCIRRS